MCRHLLLAAAWALFATPVLAIDMPTRKAGLWELRMTFAQPELPAHIVRQCTDAAVDKLMHSGLGGSAQQTCVKQEIHQANGAIVVNSVCSFAGMTTESRSVITGSFNSAYRMEVTTRQLSGPRPPGVGENGERHMVVSAAWVGPCARGQRPGDIMMPGGMNVNVIDLRKMQGAEPAE